MTNAGTTWMDRLASDVADQRFTPGQPLVCASGVSPSGPIHLGNFREVFTTHLVAEALRELLSDAEVRHLHSWDDYDRFRKVPAGVDKSWERHIGKPLALVPDPYERAESYGDHFRREFTGVLGDLGITLHEVRQSEMYPSGVYNSRIRHAMDNRALIFDFLSAQQTQGRHEKSVDERRAEYYPFKPYCEQCGKDFTTVDGYENDTVTYHCACSHSGTMSLADNTRISGKLAWKVDWPMRWAFENVVFEPAGEDHHAPTAGFTVGRQLVKALYDGAAPNTTVYSFVKLAGQNGKMSGSAGGAAIPATALDLLEPAILRWVYTRRLPNQAVQIDLGAQAVQRLYDEWDRFERSTDPVDIRVGRFAHRTSLGRVRTASRPVSFRLLSSAADITQASRPQIARIVTEHLDGRAPDAEALLTELEPRLSCAINWATMALPPEDRTTVNTAFNAEAFAGLDSESVRGVELLATEMADHWTLEGLTALVYSVPKRLLGLSPEAVPNPEIKKAQRDFFKALYRLLVNRDTGPRLPTLLLSIGPDRARTLLTKP